MGTIINYLQNNPETIMFSGTAIIILISGIFIILNIIFFVLIIIGLAKAIKKFL